MLHSIRTRIAHPTSSVYAEASNECLQLVAGSRDYVAQSGNKEDVKGERDFSARQIRQPPQALQLGSLACSILRTFAVYFPSPQQSQIDDHFVLVIYSHRSMSSTPQIPENHFGGRFIRIRYCSAARHVLA